MNQFKTADGPVLVLLLTAVLLFGDGHRATLSAQIAGPEGNARESGPATAPGHSEQKGGTGSEGAGGTPQKERDTTSDPPPAGCVFREKPLGLIV